MYVARRLVRFASEDVGNADPQALVVAVAARDALHFIGMPEGNTALAQAAIYLATAPKSNAVYLAYGAAAEAAEHDVAEPVPLHLRNAPTRLMKSARLRHAATSTRTTSPTPCRRHGLPARAAAGPRSSTRRPIAASRRRSSAGWTGGRRSRIDGGVLGDPSPAADALEPFAPVPVARCGTSPAGRGGTRSNRPSPAAPRGCAASSRWSADRCAFTAAWQAMVAAIRFTASLALPARDRARRGRRRARAARRRRRPRRSSAGTAVTRTLAPPKSSSSKPNRASVGGAIEQRLRGRRRAGRAPSARAAAGSRAVPPVSRSRMRSNSTRSCATCWSTMTMPSSSTARMKVLRNWPSGIERPVEADRVAARPRRSSRGSASRPSSPARSPPATRRPRRLASRHDERGRGAAGGHPAAAAGRPGMTSTAAAPASGAAPPKRVGHAAPHAPRGRATGRRSAPRPSSGAR